MAAAGLFRNHLSARWPTVRELDDSLAKLRVQGGALCSAGATWPVSTRIAAVNLAGPEKQHCATTSGVAVGGTFAMREVGRVDNLRILLLDDVRTTGATLGRVCESVTPGRRKLGPRTRRPAEPEVVRF